MDVDSVNACGVKQWTVCISVLKGLIYLFVKLLLKFLSNAVKM